MLYFIDTNILLYAVNTGCSENKKSKNFLENCISNNTSCSLSWSVVYEFLRVSTHSKVFPNPLKPKQAYQFIDALLLSKNFSILEHTEKHQFLLEQNLNEYPKLSGNLIHDAHTATLIREHGIPKVVTNDTDFLQFKFVEVVNPLLG